MVRFSVVYYETMISRIASWEEMFGSCTKKCGVLDLTVWVNWLGGSRLFDGRCATPPICLRFTINGQLASLPLQDLQSGDMVKMGIASRERQLMFQRKGSNPDIVFRNGGSSPG